MDSERIFFITTITAQRQPIFRQRPTVNLLLDTLAHYRDQGKYLLHEFVVMPDHLHALITPAEEISLERAVQYIIRRVLISAEVARTRVAGQFHEPSRS